MYLSELLVDFVTYPLIPSEPIYPFLSLGHSFDTVCVVQQNIAKIQWFYITAFVLCGEVI